LVFTVLASDVIGDGNLARATRGDRDSMVRPAYRTPRHPHG
jgi:hypothetical protein